MTGTIVAVEDHGTIGILWVEDQDGVEHPVYFDHRCLQPIVDDYVADCLGRRSATSRGGANRILLGPPAYPRKSGSACRGRASNKA